ncbi:MAG: hypothetical protein L6Q99_02665 [Planctomycetes bacterium]|nr:hypothetical protein [Planctomycetota bacterium]
METMLDTLGKPHAKVDVLSSPRISGYSNAKQLLVDRLLEQYCDREVILFLPDSDLRDRTAEFSRLGEEARRHGAKLICCAAVPEVEAWLLAGHVDKLSFAWSDLRAHPTLKQSIFEPFLAQYGDPRRPGGGRDLLMRETLRNYAGLVARCAELGHLESEIQGLLS